MSMTETQEDHALANGRAWLANIVEMVERHKAASDTNDDAATETIEREMDEAPLSVEVRSAWHTPGDEDGDKPSEYRILLTTGGPALQLVGELSEYGEPETAKLQHQDWFKPWTDMHGLTEEEDGALLTFSQRVYFGE